MITLFTLGMVDQICSFEQFMIELRNGHIFMYEITTSLLFTCARDTILDMSTSDAVRRTGNRGAGRIPDSDARVSDVYIHVYVPRNRSIAQR